MLYLRKAVPSPKGTWEARDFSRERLHVCGMSETEAIRASITIYEPLKANSETNEDCFVSNRESYSLCKGNGKNKCHDIVVFMKIMRCIILHMTIDSVKKFKDSGFAVLFLILKYLPYFLL